MITVIISTLCANVKPSGMYAIGMTKNRNDVEREHVKCWPMERAQRRIRLGHAFFAVLDYHDDHVLDRVEDRRPPERAQVVDRQPPDAIGNLEHDDNQRHVLAAQSVQLPEQQQGQS
jgi:hypothetical protein